MALTAANVQVGVTGAVYFAPSGTAVPTNPTDALNGAFLDVGYISEDGVTTSTSIDVTDLVAWQNADVVRKIQTGHDYTVAWTMLETSENTLELYYGNYTDAGAYGTAEVKGEQGYRGAFVIHVIDDTNLVRIAIPDGQVTEKGDVSIVNGDAISYPITITCYPDTSGVKAYVYTQTVGAS
ncbi:MAG: hypothetical protein OEV62_00155 [Actinomycetota bacterium]|nr:hypothetical protein [Actinomycetota bacterium]